MTMQNKIKLVIFLLFIQIITNSFAQSKDENLVRQVLVNQQKSWNNGNLEKFMQGYWNNDSLMFVGQNGVSYGWKTTLAHYKKGYPDSTAMGKLNFTFLHLKSLSSNYFFVIGKWHLKRSAGDLQGHFTLLFKKINQQWRIIVDHTD